MIVRAILMVMLSFAVLSTSVSADQNVTKLNSKTDLTLVLELRPSSARMLQEVVDREGATLKLEKLLLIVHDHFVETVILDIQDHGGKLSQVKAVDEAARTFTMVVSFPAAKNRADSLWQIERNLYSRVPNDEALRGRMQLGSYANLTAAPTVALYPNGGFGMQAEGEFQFHTSEEESFFDKFYASEGVLYYPIWKGGNHEIDIYAHKKNPYKQSNWYYVRKDKRTHVAVGIRYVIRW